MPIAALLLDLDDTLLDERPGRARGRAVLVTTLRAARPELPLDGLGAALDEDSTWFWSDASRHAAGRLDLFAARLAIVRRTLARFGGDDATLARAAVERYVAERDAALDWMAGAQDALAALRAAVPRLGLLTNGAADAQRAKLARFDLARWFDHVQIEGAQGFGKPEARAFHCAAEALGVAPERTVMVGNDFEFDVLGALAAGLGAVWVDVDGAGAPPAVAPREHAVVRSVAKVPEWVGRLAG